MDESMSLWRSNLLEVKTSTGSKAWVVNVKIFDEIAGKVIDPNISRKFRKVVKEFMNGFDINIDDIIQKHYIRGQSKESTFIAVSIDFSHYLIL